MRRYERAMVWAVAPLITVMILGVGWAEHMPVPEEVSEEYLEFLNRTTYMPEATGETESQYGDCTFSYATSSPNLGRGGNTDMSMDCGIGHGGGGGGGGDQRLFNLLMPDFDRHRDSITWEQTGIEFCAIQTIHHARHPGHGPNTLSINIDCWWMDDITTLNATDDDRPVEELASESVHAVLGVVIQTSAVPYNVTMSDAMVADTTATVSNATFANMTGVNATSTNATDTIRETIFTEVTVAVNEDMRGTYDAKLIMFRFEGGSIDDTRVINPSAPEFELGEQVLVLVGEPDPDGYYPIVGQVNGKYSITDDGFAIVGPRDRYVPFDIGDDRSSTLDELRQLFADVPLERQATQETVQEAAP